MVRIFCCFFLALLFSEGAFAVKLSSRKQLPAGAILFDYRPLETGRKSERYSFELKWGERKKGGTLTFYRASDRKNKTVMEVEDRVLDRVFQDARKLAAAHVIPPSPKKGADDADGFQLSVGVTNDQAFLSYPGTLPESRNRALPMWRALCKLVEGEVKELPELEPLPVGEGGERKPGLGKLSDYTDFKIRATLVRHKPVDYAMLEVSWKKDREGKVVMSARYDPRAGDRVDAAPNPKEIARVFKQLQKMAGGYRIPNFSKDRKGASERGYDRVDLELVSGVGGTSSGWYYTPHEKGQWNEALRFWGMLTELFPEDGGEKMLK